MPELHTPKLPEKESSHDNKPDRFAYRPRQPTMGLVVVRAAIYARVSSSGQASDGT